MAKEIKKWTTLESRYIIQRPWLTARVDKVQLPDGRINPEHYVLAAQSQSAYRLPSMP